MVGEDLLVGGVARPEVEAALDEAVLAAAGEDASKAVGVLHVLGVEEAASIEQTWRIDLRSALPFSIVSKMNDFFER